MNESGLEMTELRAELYVQTMKQLTKNPNPASQQRCWEVVTLMLQCFPPPKVSEVAQFAAFWRVAHQFYLA